MSSSTDDNGCLFPSNGSPGYSADVHLFLILPDGARLRPGQVGPDRLIFRDPVTLPAGAAIVEVVVDGNVHRWNVDLGTEEQHGKLIRLARV